MLSTCVTRSIFFFFNDTATTEISPLSLHDPLPICIGPVVTSRIYTSVASGGTYGQSIDPITRQGYDSVVPGLRSDASFRSNIGLVNSGDTPINAADRKSTRLNSSHSQISYAGFCLI